jgi:hypothetical protein
MTEAPDATHLQDAIWRYVLQATEIAREGELHIKIALDLAPSSFATGQFTGILFLSTAWPVADPTWLTNLMACVRDGFERDLIDAPFRVTVENDEPFDSFCDEEVGKVLCNLPAHLTLAPRVKPTQAARSR